MSTKDKLMQENADQATIMSQLKIQNADLQTKLSSCNSNSKLSQDQITNLYKDVSNNKKVFGNIENKKDEDISSLLSGQPSLNTTQVPPGVLNVKTNIGTKPMVNLTVSDKVSKIQISAIWQAYNQAITQRYTK
jgi:hypothetical protein